MPEHMLAREDIEAVGMLGLLGAMRTYDASLGVPFRPYAIRRIAGEMIDAVRKLDPVPHPSRAVIRKADRAAAGYSRLLSKAAAAGGAASSAGSTVAKMAALTDRVATMAQPRHVDELVAGDEHDPLTLGDTIPGAGQANDPIEETEEEDAFRRRLRVHLTPLELDVAMAFHVDDLPLFEIAKSQGLNLMETAAVLGRVSYKLGARDELGRLLPITPKRKADVA